VHCPECLQANPDDARFCLRCGTPLGSVEAEDRLRQVTAATPASLATKLRAAPMGDERKLVSILFADVVGSTQLAENLDAEEWKELINGAFDRITAPIHRYEGTVAQFLGDGFLAFFGAPVTHEDDADRAVRASLDLIDAARAYGKDVRERAGLDFAVRVGIHSGPVVVGAVGTDLHYEYLAVGDTVNVAARLQAAAEPMTVLISERTRRLLSDGFEVADERLIDVRGRADPIRVFTARTVPVGTEHSHPPAPLASPMVGRAEELEQLIEATRATRAGVGRLVVIVGEPGIGKSTLVREWRAAERERRTGWAQANMPAHASGIPYHLAAEAVRAMLGLEPGADEAALDSVLRAAGADGRLLSGRPYLAALLSIPLAEDQVAAAPALSPQGRQARYIELVLAVARTVARSPLVLVLNDVHWSDASSVAILTPLLALHAELPLLVAVVARPDADAPGWRLVEVARELSGAGLVEISLDPLQLGDGDQLLANLIGQPDVPAGVADLVRQRGEGNPLFVEEIVRMLIEREFLVRSDGGWELRPNASSDIPDTLQGLLAARIDRLDADTRRALRVASVIGRQFSVPVLERLLERSA
jgi:class 3 adenylate cyclase